VTREARAKLSDQDDYLKRLEARIAALESVPTTRTPDDERLDNLLRKFAKSIEMTAWLGGMCLKVSPVIAALWFFGDQALQWARESATQWLGR